MRFLIVGGGALGTVVAGYLARAGNDVSLFVKPAHAAAFSSPEVQVTGITSISAPVTVACDASTLGSFDNLMVCVKGRDSRAALDPLRGVAVETVLSLQNGVKKDETLAHVFGRERVLGALALVSGQMERPGVAVNTATSEIAVGELDGRISERCERLAAVIRDSGIPSICVPDIGRREWAKLTLYLSLALVGGVSRLDSATIVFDPDLSRVAIDLAGEAAAVAAAEGSPLRETEGGYRSVLEAFIAPVRTAGAMHYMSLTQDLLAGRPTELEETAGDVLDRARRHGIAVPTIEACTDIIRGLERAGGGPPGASARASG